MPVPTPVDIAVNPNNDDQFYVLWGTGRIDPHGGALPITDGPTWYDRYDQPVAVAMHVTDWAGPSGYVFDFAGGIHAFGGATAIMDTSGDIPVNSNGIPYALERRYADWQWNPDGSGQLYAVSFTGELFEGGGALDPVRLGPRFSTPAVKAFKMRWSPDKRGYLLDHFGGLHPEWNAVTPNPPPPYYLGQDVARDFEIIDWDTGAGFLLTADGAAHPFGGASSSLYGGPYRAGADVARQIYILSASDPTEIRQVHAGGEVIDYVASDPPSVTAGGSLTVSPAATVTATTRPVLSWDYSDPQSDSQAAWRVLVFTAAFVAGHDMSDPSVWASSALVNLSGINPGTRGVTCPIDLPNGDYVEYVQAQDSAGQWSAWDDHAWTQNVPVPATPTDLTAVADDATHTVALSVSATAGSADFLRFEASDDAGVTWAPIPEIDALPLAASVTATDRFIPLGVQRTYRAVAYSVDPRTASVPSATATAQISDLTYVLTVVGDPTLGGAVHVQEPVEWSRPVPAGVYQGLGSEFPIVVSDGGPRARRTTLHLLSMDRATWDMIERVGEANATLCYRDQFGEVMFCRLVGDWSRALTIAAPGPTDNTAVRHMHSTDLPLVEVAPPVTVA